MQPVDGGDEHQSVGDSTRHPIADRLSVFVHRRCLCNIFFVLPYYKGTALIFPSREIV
jgi:hypothetical protein